LEIGWWEKGKGRGAYIDVPYAVSDIVRSRSGTSFVCVAADDLVPGLGLEIPYPS
jgi:hypothetical protein